MAITPHCDPIDGCENCGRETFHYGNYGWEPFGGCEGEAVPHSSNCAQSGGESDFEDYLAGEWLEFTETPDCDPMDWTCECVRKHWNGTDRDHWTVLYSEHVRESMPDRADFTADEAHRQFQLAHAKHVHEAQREAQKETKDA